MSTKQRQHEKIGIQLFKSLWWIALTCYTGATILISCGSQSLPEWQGMAMIEHPCQTGAQSALTVDMEGHPLSSWLEYLDDTMVAFRYARLEDNQWTQPQTVATGHHWFVNWADFPSLVDCGDFMAAHWLQYRGNGPYQYDVRISLSPGKGLWDEPFTPHRDSIKAEHGFVSLLPLKRDELLAVWLDGRFTGPESDHSDHSHSTGGAMTLRAISITANGASGEDLELDDRVCDCCQTDAALTDQGPVVVYRNRTEEEIRDIYLVRRVDGIWQDPFPVYNDQWQIAACPVNGPAIAAMGNLVAVLWYTMANDQAKVKIALSRDSGANFSEPVVISDQMPLGRVDVTFIDSENLIAIWVEDGEATATIMAKFISADLKSSPEFILTETSASRASGFPRIASADGRIYLSWTDYDEDTYQVRTAELKYF